MPTKYFCAHCDLEFTPEGSEAAPRCPKCMRRGGVQPVSHSSARPRASRHAWMLAALTIAVGAVGIAIYRSQKVTLEDMPPLRSLSAREVAAYLERDQLQVGTYATVLALPDGVEGWPEAPLDLSNRLHAESSRWSLERALPRDVYTAEQALGAMEASDERIELYPIEMASAMVALLRERGVDAMVAEVWELAAADAPADPSGMLGYFVTAIVDRETGEASAYYDVWGGRGEIEPEAVRVLRDTEVIAAALGVGAARVFSSFGDSKAALALVETGLALDPRAVSLRVTHANVLLDSGGFPQALEELDAAMGLHPDGPRELARVQLRLARAAMLSANGQQAAAQEELRESSRILAELIDRWPRYGRAHLTLATVYLGLGDRDRARVELGRAEELSSDSPMLWAAWAQYHLAAGEAEVAASNMHRALALDPENWQLRVQAAGVFLEAGDEASARKNADEALRLVAADRRETLRRYLDGIAKSRDTALSEPSRAPSRTQTSDDSEPALMLGDPSNLRLRDPQDTLELDLGSDD